MNMTIESIQSAINRGWKNVHAVCGFQNCTNTMLMLSVPQSRAGIRVGAIWYCGVDCFARAAMTRLAALSEGRVTEMPHTPRLSVGLAMLSKGYLTDNQLRCAVTESRMRGEELEAVLMRLGLASEKQLAAARAVQWGCPVMGNEVISQPIEADIPTTLLRICSAVPLRYSHNGKRLLMGFVYRVEHSFLHALELITGCRAEPCFVTQTEFDEQMARITTVPDCEEVVLDEPQTPKQMANTVGSLAVEVAAREANFVHCRSYIWTRLLGRRRKVDVLFRAPQGAGEKRWQTLPPVENKIELPA